MLTDAQIDALTEDCRSVDAGPGYDRFDVARAIEAEVRKEIEWQPIETAPTGTPILITDGKVVTVTELVACGNMPKTMSGHGFSGWEYEYDFRYGEATHWMPLPALPQVKP